MEHEEEIKQLLDSLEESRIIAGAIFEKYANDCDYDRAVLFQLIRDSLEQQKIAAENMLNDYRVD